LGRKTSLIPFFGIDRQYATIREEILSAVDRVYSSGKVLDGDFTKIFENAIAKRCGRRYAVAVNSCTQALIFVNSYLMRNHYSDEFSPKILLPGISFAATVNSVLMAACEPVFCDVDRNGLLNLESLDMSLDSIGIQAVTNVDLFGHVNDYDRLRMHLEFFNFNDVVVIEDAAQSFGASYKGRPAGSLGDVSVLSFDPTKNLPNYGSGGMILTDNPDLREYMLDIRNNGKLFEHTYVGTNSKISESDSAQMLVKLKHFDSWQARRREIAEYYQDSLHELSDDIEIIRPGEDVESAWHKFVIRVDDRVSLYNFMNARGVEARIHYPTALFDLPCLSSIPTSNSVVESLAFAQECISLPIYPELTDAEIETVAETVVSFYR